MSGVTSTRRGVPRLFRDSEDGNAVVEFALIMVPLIGLIGAILETGLVLFASNNLSAATRQAARTMLTGAAQGAGIADANTFRTTYICPANGPRVLASFIDCSKLIIDVRTATSFSGQDMTSDFYKTQATNQFCLGAPGTIMVVRIAYPMPSIMPILQGFVRSFSANTVGLVNDVPGSSGLQHLLVGTAIFETEPYPTGSYTKAKNC